MTKYNKNKVIKAIEGTGGIKAIICRRLNIQRWIFNKWLNQHPHIMEYYVEECEKILDIAEGHILKKVNAGEDIHTIKWYLANKGKFRGYNENSGFNLNMNNAGQTTISLNIPKEVIDIIQQEENSNGPDS